LPPHHSSACSCNADTDGGQYQHRRTTPPCNSRTPKTLPSVQSDPSPSNLSNDNHAVSVRSIGLSVHSNRPSRKGSLVWHLPKYVIVALELVRLCIESATMSPWESKGEL